MNKKSDNPKIEVINGRFVKGSRARLEELARRLSVTEGRSISVSMLVESAVTEKYLPKVDSLLERIETV